MTNNNNQKFTLKNRETGELVRMERTGEPFVYSSKQLASQGKRALEKDREIQIAVIPA